MKHHVRHSCKIAPTEKNGEAGLVQLYQHTLLQQKVKQLESQVAKLVGQAARHAAIQDLAIIQTVHNTTNTTTVDNSHNTVNINVFGQDPLPKDIRLKIQEALRVCAQADTPESGAVLLITQITALLYGDPSRPETMSCYLPNVRSTDTMVHAQGGWEIQPIRHVGPAMTQRAVDCIFHNQYFEPMDLVESCAPMLIKMANNDEYVTGTTGAAAARTTLLSNRTHLKNILGKLPKAGTITKQDGSEEAARA